MNFGASGDGNRPMNWRVCLEINTGRVNVAVTPSLVVDGEMYRELQREGIDLPALDGMEASKICDMFAPAYPNVSERTFWQLKDLARDCYSHPMAKVSVRQ